MDDLRAHLRGRLADYKVPRQVRLVQQLPRNAAGKVIKRELEATLATEGPSAERSR